MTAESPKHSHNVRLAIVDKLISHALRQDHIGETPRGIWTVLPCCLVVNVELVQLRLIRDRIKVVIVLIVILYHLCQPVYYRNVGQDLLQLVMVRIIDALLDQVRPVHLAKEVRQKGCSEA